ncbi:MAG TPA: hypothetical protein VIF62_39330 [Labilithrix sp.]|jgi:serine/threonine protein kinase
MRALWGTVRENEENEGIGLRLVTARFDGETLEERLCGAGALDVRDVVRLGVQLLDALADAHDRGVVHGGLRPDGVLIVEHGGALAGAMIVGWGGGALETESALGFAPVPFVAPERVAGEAASISADLYAVGALLYLAATGFPPCASLSHADLPARLVRVLVQALQRDPVRRFADAREMRDALACVCTASQSGIFPSLGAKQEEEEEEAMPPTRRLSAPLALVG